MVPGGEPHTFEVVVITRTDEEAQRVIDTLTAGPHVLGDVQDPRSFPFPYIIDATRKPGYLREKVGGPGQPRVAKLTSSEKEKA